MSLREKIKRFSDETWAVGVVKNSLEGIVGGGQVEVEWAKIDLKKSWFADPFVLKADDKEITILAEEFPRDVRKGRISKVVINKGDLRLVSKDVVLELPTHLSFPVIIRRETAFGKELDKAFGESEGYFVWLMPENGASGKLTVYKYWTKENHIESQGSVLDEAVEDAVPITIGEQTYLFCTPRSNPNGNKLRIYEWKADDARFSFVKSVTFHENVARMAGMFFTLNGKLYRPTQECDVQYGHAITIQEVNIPDNDIERISFHEVRRIYSSNPLLTVGTHTLNMHDDVIITDSLGFTNMWLRRVLKKLGIR